MTVHQRHVLQQERATEALRQERVIFEQLAHQNRQWFRLRWLMGYAALLILVAVVVVATWVIFQPNAYPVHVVTAATGVMFADVIAVVFAIAKIVLNPNFATELRPVTVVSPDEQYRTNVA